MAHDHGHQHQTSNERRVFWALIITAAFMLVEVAGGLISGSLALLADAGHMLTDAIALLFSWIAFRAARNPADDKRSYGYHRLQIVAAFVNGLTLVVVVGWIVIEAVRRIAEPVAIMGDTMLAVAVAGLIVNVAAFWIIHGGDKNNLNLASAAAHVMGDILGSAATIVAALVILLFGWTLADPVLSLLVALLILKSSWSIIRKSMHILLEGTPDWLDVEELKHRLVAALPEVTDVHHVHAWSLTTERPMITLHASVDGDGGSGETLLGIKRLLADDYGITHSTIQIECGDCTDET
ncbi:MAG: cation diffusion facilitator family transporter [Rhodospirillaceae bacterium]|nr:cation diffusion facilitator family transporter [Rhodospirillaceae bacterium]